MLWITALKVAEHSFCMRSCWSDTAHAQVLQKNKQAIDSAIISLVRLYADSLNKEYLTNRVYVVNSNEGLGGNLGSKINVSNGGQQNSNWQTLSTQLKKQTFGPRPQSCVRKHFPLISFLNQWKIQHIPLNLQQGIIKDLCKIIIKILTCEHC